MGTKIKVKDFQFEDAAAGVPKEVVLYLDTDYTVQEISGHYIKI